MADPNDVSVPDADTIANVMPDMSEAYVPPADVFVPEMPTSEFLPEISLPEFESAPSFAAEVPAPAAGPTLAAAAPEQGISFLWSPPAGTDPSLVLGGIYQSLGVTPANVKVNQVSSGAYKIFVPLREMNQAGVAAASSMKAGTLLTADGSLQYGGAESVKPLEAGLPGWALAAEAARRGFPALAKEIAASLATKGGGAAAVSAAQAEAAALSAASAQTVTAAAQAEAAAALYESAGVLETGVGEAALNAAKSPAVRLLARTGPTAAVLGAGAAGVAGGLLTRQIPYPGGGGETVGEFYDKAALSLFDQGPTGEKQPWTPKSQIGSLEAMSIVPPDFSKAAPAPAFVPGTPGAYGESLIEPGPKADAAAQALADASKPGLVARTPPTSEILAKQATGKAPAHTAFWDTADKIKDDPVMINALMSNDASQIGGFDKATIARNLPLLKAEAAQIPPEDTAKAAVYSQAISLLEAKLGKWSPETQIASAKALAKNPMQLVNIPAGADPAKVSSYITGSQNVAAAATNLQAVANSNPTATELDQAESGLRMAVASAYSTGMTYAPGFLQNENAFGMTQWNPQGLMMAGGLGLSLYEIFYRAPQERKDQQEWQMLMYQMSKQDSIDAEARAVEQQKELYAFKAETDEETGGSAESTSKPYVPDL